MEKEFDFGDRKYKRLSRQPESLEFEYLTKKDLYCHITDKIDHVKITINPSRINKKDFIVKDLESADKFLGKIDRAPDILLSLLEKRMKQTEDYRLSKYKKANVERVKAYNKHLSSYKDKSTKNRP